MTPDQVHQKLEELFLTNDVASTPSGILIDIVYPIHHRIELIKDDSSYVWKIKLENHGVTTMITTANAERILKEQEKFRVRQYTMGPPDQGTTVVIVNQNEINVVSNYEGRFNIVTNDDVVCKKPFIDYWKYILEWIGGNS